jgi:hypothetical protein
VERVDRLLARRLPLLLELAKLQLNSQTQFELVLKMSSDLILPLALLEELRLNLSILLIPRKLARPIWNS